MSEVLTERRGATLVGTISNPPHGLMNAEIVDSLDRLVSEAENDESVGAVVLTGAHPDRFVAHYDVAEIHAGAAESPSVGARAADASLRATGLLRRIPGADEALSRGPAAGLVAIERFHELFLRMNRCGAVFIAAINGSAQGGGCELSLACDRRIMAAGDHLIGQPEILLGFPPGGGGTQRLARLLGSSKALELVLDGGPLSPEQALEIGLIDEVVEGGRVLDRALEVAERLGSRPRAAIAASKRAVYEGGSLSLADGLRFERAQFMAALGTAEADQLMRAYLAGLERTGELPLYDEAGREQALEQGRFGKDPDSPE